MKKADDGWQIIVVFDHGQITATRQINVAEELTKAGFRVGLATEADVDVAVKRSYAGISIRDRDPAITETVFQWLIKQDCAVWYSAGEMEGALPWRPSMSHERAPDPTWSCAHPTERMRADIRDSALRITSTFRWWRYSWRIASA